MCASPFLSMLPFFLSTTTVISGVDNISCVRYYLQFWVQCLFRRCHLVCGCNPFLISTLCGVAGETVCSRLPEMGTCRVPSAAGAVGKSARHRSRALVGCFVKGFWGSRQLSRYLGLGAWCTVGISSLPLGSWVAVRPKRRCVSILYRNYNHRASSSSSSSCSSNIVVCERRRLQTPLTSNAIVDERHRLQTSSSCSIFYRSKL